MATQAFKDSTPCSPPATVAEVANEFLRLAQSEPQFGVVDQMKLQKMLFYAHAWHLAYGNGPLFENDFEAWPWGPVVRDIYMQTKDYGRGQVTDRIWEFARGSSGFEVIVPEGVDASLKPFIKSVWDVMKKYSAIQLSNSTHAPGEPWTIVANELGTTRKPTIPNDLIEDTFKKKIKS